jgi:hypothetical protein
MKKLLLRMKTVTAEHRRHLLLLPRWRELQSDEELKQQWQELWWLQMW